jgi:hypothetical protein
MCTLRVPGEDAVEHGVDEEEKEGIGNTVSSLM